MEDLEWYRETHSHTNVSKHKDKSHAEFCKNAKTECKKWRKDDDGRAHSEG